MSVRVRSSAGVENVRLPVGDTRASLGRPSRYGTGAYVAPQTMRRPPRFPPRPGTGARKWTRISHVCLEWYVYDRTTAKYLFEILPTIDFAYAVRGKRNISIRFIRHESETKMFRFGGFVFYRNPIISILVKQIKLPPPLKKNMI